MKKITLISALVAGVAALCGLAVAGTSVTVFSAPGLRTGLVADVAQVAHVEVIGGLPAASTSVLSRVVGTKTNTVATLVLSGGAKASVITNGAWILRGDSLLWTGSTSGVARVILAY